VAQRQIQPHAPCANIILSLWTNYLVERVSNNFRKTKSTPQNRNRSRVAIKFKMGFLKLSVPLILAASLLSSVAQAAPARRAIKARDYVTEIVTETIWETVDITTTVYVDELPTTAAPASTTAEVISAAEEEEPTSIPTSTAAAPPTSPAAVTSTSAPVAPAPQPAPEPAYVAPAPAAGEFAENSAPAAAQPTPEVVAPAPAPAPAPPAPAPPAPVNQVVNTASSAGSESASCEGGSAACKGDVTHWDGGLGACGTVVDTENEMAIALPFEFMGLLSNTNPYCGRTLTIETVSGSTVQAKVGDKCMGCVGRSIDLTNKLFNAVTDGKGDGRVKNIKWWFN
jgi:hypothetical protein